MAKSGKLIDLREIIILSRKKKERKWNIFDLSG